MGKAGKRKRGPMFRRGLNFEFDMSPSSILRFAGLEYWQKEVIADPSAIPSRLREKATEGLEVQKTVEVRKVRQRWREGGVVMEQTDLKVGETEWRTWCIEGKEEKVVSWLQEKGSVLARGLVMGYPEWVSHICEM